MSSVPCTTRVGTSILENPSHGSKPSTACIWRSRPSGLSESFGSGTHAPLSANLLKNLSEKQKALTMT